MELGEDVNRAWASEIREMGAGQSGLKIDIHIKGVVLFLEPLQFLLGVLLVDMELRRNLRIGIGLQLLRISAHLSFDVRILGLQRDRNIEPLMLKLPHGATYLVSAILVELDLHTLRLEPFDITVQTGEITFDIDLHPRLRIILQKTLVIGQLPVHLPQFGLQRDRNIDAATFERLDLRLDLA